MNRDFLCPSCEKNRAHPNNAQLAYICSCGYVLTYQEEAELKDEALEIDMKIEKFKALFPEMGF